jgi:hypothetical protein
MLETYSAQDFELLVNVIDDRSGPIWVIPNTLTEASNLLAQYGIPEREMLFETLATMISDGRELFAESNDAARNPRFIQFGLTDAALLSIVSPDRQLLTADSRPYAAALLSNAESAANLNHHRMDQLVS